MRHTYIVHSSAHLGPPRLKFCGIQSRVRLLCTCSMAPGKTREEKPVGGRNPGGARAWTAGLFRGVRGVAVGSWLFVTCIWLWWIGLFSLSVWCDFCARRKGVIGDNNSNIGWWWWCFRGKRRDWFLRRISKSADLLSRYLINEDNLIVIMYMLLQFI